MRWKLPPFQTALNNRGITTHSVSFLRRRRASLAFLDARAGLRSIVYTEIDFSQLEDFNRDIDAHPPARWA